MDRIGSILFLALFALIPVALVAALVLVIVRSAAGGRAWVTNGRAVGLEVIRSRTAEWKDLARRLESTVFSLRPGLRNRITHAVGGAVEGIPIWVARTVSTSRSPNPETRFSSEGFVTLVGVPTAGNGLLLMNPARGRLAGLLLSAFSSLAPPQGENWKPLLTTSPADFAALGLADEKADAVRAVLHPGDVLALFPMGIVHARPSGNSMSAREIRSYLDPVASRARQLAGLSARR